MQSRLVPEKCIACGLCQVYAPNIFDYDDHGIVLFRNEPHARQRRECLLSRKTGASPFITKTFSFCRNFLASK